MLYVVKDLFQFPIWDALCLIVIIYANFRSENEEFKAHDATWFKANFTYGPFWIAKTYSNSHRPPSRLVLCNVQNIVDQALTFVSNNGDRRSIAEYISAEFILIPDIFILGIKSHYKIQSPKYFPKLIHSK